MVLGTIEVLSDEDDENPIVTLTAGSCLGETSLILSLPAKCSVRTATYTELQVISFVLIFFFAGNGRQNDYCHWLFITIDTFNKWEWVLKIFIKFYNFKKILRHLRQQLFPV